MRDVIIITSQQAASNFSFFIVVDCNYMTSPTQDSIYEFLNAAAKTHKSPS